MHYELNPYPLTDPAGWSALEAGLPRHRAVTRLIQHLKDIGVLFCVEETRYIDRDYSAEYRAFYSQTFKNYPHHCRRLHFFAKDLNQVFSEDDWKKKSELLGTDFKNSYCGFSVIRPLARAPLGRTVLLPHQPVLDCDTVLTVRADHIAHIWGAELSVSGAPFTQQDSRVGSCAQASIWMAARHMHARYRYGWYSTADITHLASPTDATVSVSLPAGSDFLLNDGMTRAIRAMGFQPLCCDENTPSIARWMLPYIDSGLPVVLGFTTGPSDLGHAVTVVGRVFKQNPKPRRLPLSIHECDPLAWFRGFIAHDDQGGPYTILPTDSVAGTDAYLGGTAPLVRQLNGKIRQLNLLQDAKWAVAFMPMKVFSKAEAAEESARVFISRYVKNASRIKTALRSHHGRFPVSLDKFVLAHKKRQVVLHTYLTSAAGYRRYIAESGADNQLKGRLLQLHLPHFVWVTEIASSGTFNHISYGFRRIFGHTIYDATSSGRDVTGQLAAHLPGVVMFHDVNPADPGVEFEESAFSLPDDVPYGCREKRLRR